MHVFQITPEVDLLTDAQLLHQLEAVVLMVIGILLLVAAEPPAFSIIRLLLTGVLIRQEDVVQTPGMTGVHAPAEATVTSLPLGVFLVPARRHQVVVAVVITGILAPVPAEIPARILAAAVQLQAINARVSAVVEAPG